MISYTTGNLLDSPAEALVNTVNTVGVMGKGIALMFKERFPENMREYAQACKAGNVVTGTMFVTETQALIGPRWIVNFPTKQHWRAKSKMEWIEAGLEDLRRFILEHKVRSIAIPPLGAGNGGLSWQQVKPKIAQALGDLDEVQIWVYEPTAQYQNVAKSSGVKKLTPARALVAELVRRYWVLGIECSLLEIQKLAWFLHRAMLRQGLEDPLKLDFTAHKYGPYANNLNHLLNALDGSYLSADKRVPDCQPLDAIWFNEQEKSAIALYLRTEAKPYLPALEEASELISGFESPFGMELLATVDWLLQAGCAPELPAVKAGIAQWPAGKPWAERKMRLFSDENLEYALERLRNFA